MGKLKFSEHIRAIFHLVVNGCRISYVSVGVVGTALAAFTALGFESILYAIGAIVPSQPATARVQPDQNL